jgi:tRNA threonylcarbamoyladenosine biosynthesis protein TsaB
VLVLAIETSTPTVSVAVGRDGVVVGAVRLFSDRRHAEQLAPAIRHVCTETGTSLGQVAAVAVGIGPGLFTGLRVGVTTAKVMAEALRVPVVGVPTLDLVAYPLRHGNRTVVAVLDARRREVFTARYRGVPGGLQRVSDYAVMPPADLAAELDADADTRAHGALLAGDGATRYADVFAAVDHAELAGPEFAVPSIVALVALSAARVEREDFVPARELVPMYLRRSDAEIAWDVHEAVG